MCARPAAAVSPNIGASRRLQPRERKLEMSVHKRGGRWHFTTTIDGVRYRGALKTARTKAQAEEAEIKILNQIHEGTYRRPTEVGTLKDFAEEVYMPWAKDNKKSWKSDRAMLDSILA